MLKTRILVIITVGMSVGFLLGMGVCALLRAMIAGGDRGLEMTFTALVVCMAGILITYGLKFSPAGEATPFGKPFFPQALSNRPPSPRARGRPFSMSSRAPARRSANDWESTPHLEGA